MGYSKFGEFMRILRIKKGEYMGQIAEMLGTTTPFLSAVENGKKNVPKTWKEKIVEHYSLNESEIIELENAIEASKLQMKFDLRNSGEKKRQAVLQFARSFDDVDEETAEKILKLLEAKKDGSHNKTSK